MPCNVTSAQFNVKVTTVYWSSVLVRVGMGNTKLPITTVYHFGARMVDHNDKSNKSNHVVYAHTAMDLSAVAPGLCFEMPSSINSITIRR
jgi:hypothetical protein